MAVFKCKMCGGTLEVNNNESVAICEYCGTQQTLPKLDDEKRAQLYDRANYFRRENEFDKAMGIYEMILSEEKTDSEAYWGIVLCRYGIEYVEDPRTHKRIPTVNRAQFTSIFDDDDYKSALQYADTLQKIVYEEEAAVIDKIQKGILAISQKEEPFDVFICYKETDVSGKRTQDSVYAQDIYTALTKEGYKVFFSRITLEDKLGSAYEPYIFAALNSAKVMLVVGTSKDNFNAVWVKNEWSRFLNLIKAGKDKTLIPVYKDISPYDMPEEFQYLQSQDMGKIGFMQDLVRGISKLVETNKTTVKETVIVNNSNNTAPLLERAFMFLEDGDWNSADEYCEKVLDIDPKCAEAYFGKLMVDLKVHRQNDLGKLQNRIDENSNFQKAYRFGNEKIRAKLTEYTENIEAIRKDAILEEAKSKMTGDKISNYESAIELLKSIRSWKDADECINLCKSTVDELTIKKNLESEKVRKERARRKKKNKTILTTSLSVISVIIAITLLVMTIIIPRKNFSDIVSISAGRFVTVGLKSNSTVVAIGKNNYGQCNVNSWGNIVAISEGDFHTVGLKIDGTVVAVGLNEYGQCNVTGWADIIAVDAGGYHTVGLKSNGTVVAVGSNSQGQCDVEDWKDIVAISEGDFHTVGLKIDGTVVAVGSNSQGQCDVEDWKDIVAISTGSYHTIGLQSDGTVVATNYTDSDNDYNFGQCDVGNWTDIVAISAGEVNSIGLKSDGTVVAVGLNEYGQCDVEGWTDIVSISTSGNHTVGLKSDGTVVAVGLNFDGQSLVGRKK